MSAPIDIMNRFKQHKMSDDHKQKSDMLRKSFTDLALYIDAYCTDSREKSLALTKLEESMFWVNADLARNNDDTKS